MKKEKFAAQYKSSIVKWTMEHKKEILHNIKADRYTWKGLSAHARNELEKAIILARQRNCGGIDLETANRIYNWGFGTTFYLQNEEKVREATRRAFEFLDQGDCYRAVKTLMPISWKTPHPSGATKILGLSNQSELCIYDSRVGNALKDLRKDGRKIILCPSGSGRKGDHVPIENASQIWAENYQKLIWTLEIIRECLKEESSHLRIADIEMALFMMGKDYGGIL